MLLPTPLLGALGACGERSVELLTAFFPHWSSEARPSRWSECTLSVVRIT